MSLVNPTVDEVICACECALENANEHSTSATDIWDSVVSFIPSKARLQAARSLADQLASDWESFLKNVTSD